MTAEKVYSTLDIKFHGKNPFQISERVLRGEKVVFKSRKVIIRNGKSKIVEEINIPTRNTSKQDDTIKALERVNSLFKEKNIETKEQLIIN